MAVRVRAVGDRRTLISVQSCELVRLIEISGRGNEFFQIPVRSSGVTYSFIGSFWTGVWINFSTVAPAAAMPAPIFCSVFANADFKSGIDEVFEDAIRSRVIGDRDEVVGRPSFQFMSGGKQFDFLDHGESISIFSCLRDVGPERIAGLPGDHMQFAKEHLAFRGIGYRLVLCNCVLRKTKHARAQRRQERFW